MEAGLTVADNPVQAETEAEAALAPVNIKRRRAFLVLTSSILTHHSSFSCLPIFFIHHAALARNPHLHFSFSPYSLPGENSGIPSTFGISCSLMKTSMFLTHDTLE